MSPLFNKIEYWAAYLNAEERKRLRDSLIAQVAVDERRTAKAGAATVAAPPAAATEAS